MHGTLPSRAAQAREIERRICQGTDKIVGAGDFGKVCKVLWPVKTAAAIAAIAGKDERTGSRWLSGEFDPPNIVLATIMMRLSTRD